MQQIEQTRVTVADCAKTYPDGSRGLLPTSLDIHPGEIMALLGPSGCGKTTLLRLIAGLEVADAGSRISFNGQDVTQQKVEQRGVGMVFQHYALFPQMTVEANIGYGLRVRNVDDARRRQTVGEMVDLTRLNGLEHRRPAELSGGQRQRVALARALAVRPRVLLLDEPLTALDAKLKEQLRGELAQLLRSLRITAIHVTHDQQEALAIADRLAVMQAGRIVQVGDGETLYRQPAHPFVAEFLGRINRLQRNAQDLASRQLTVGGCAVTCLPQHADQATLLVRPEDIEVGAPAPGWGSAVIAQRSFMGDRVQLLLTTLDQAALNVEVPSGSVLAAGQVVGIRVNPARLLAGQE